MLILHSRLRQGLLPCALLAGLVLGLTGCGGGGSSSSSSSDNGGGSSSGGTLPITLHGTVNSGSNAVSGATVLVYAASLTPGTAPRQIGHAATAGDGSWSIGSFVPVANQLIYAVALGGNAGAGNNPQTSLMTAVITSAGASLPASLTLNELSTMAAASQLQNYITLVDCSTITGTSITAAGSTCPSIAGASGLATQAATIANLVNPVTGQDSAYLTSNAATNSTLNATLGKLNFLGNALFSCISSTGGTAGDGSACGNLLQAAWTSGSGTLTPVTGSPCDRQ